MSYYVKLEVALKKEKDPNFALYYNIRYHFFRQPMVDFHPRLAWCEESIFLVAKTNIGPLKVSEQLEDYIFAYKNDNKGPFW